MKIFLLCLFAMLISLPDMAQTFPLYPTAVPNSKISVNEEQTESTNGVTIVSKISYPTLTIFKPSSPNGTAIIICPGGGYWVNAIVHEGNDVAKRFSEWGITAFVLKYRIPNDATMVDKEIAPLQDAQQAIKTVRERAKEFGVDPSRVGIMGFSAGGHVASTASTHFEKITIENPKGTSLRPDFTVLAYPVISFQDSIAHVGSRDQLIGKNPSPQKKYDYSNELHVNEQTPPAFLMHASDDDGVSPQNSLVFYAQLLKHKVPAELHLYQKGGHGFGMKNPYTEDWMERLKNWLKVNGWVKS